jgi:hypothetical protein
MNTNNFLVKFLKICGLLEIILGVAFFFMEPILASVGVATAGFFNVMAGVELLMLGSLLWYSARDIQRYIIIILASCLFRYAIVPVEYYGSVTVPAFASILIGGLSLDIFTATLTLFLLKRGGFLKMMLPKKMPKEV